MHFLAINKRRTDPSLEGQVEALLGAEAEYVREYYAQGIFRSVWSLREVKGAAIELECESREVAMRILENLPLALAGFLEIELISLSPYRGFAAARS